MPIGLNVNLVAHKVISFHRQEIQVSITKCFISTHTENEVAHSDHLRTVSF